MLFPKESTELCLIGCKYGDDYQCHFVKGSELAEYRMSKISRNVAKVGPRIGTDPVHQLAIDEYSTSAETD